MYVIGSDISNPTINLRSRIQGGGAGRIEHSFPIRYGWYVYSFL
ncbi:MAG: hypothetical protein U0457_17120 [Candidatus Sericytochromatia bacterium]